MKKPILNSGQRWLLLKHPNLLYSRGLKRDLAVLKLKREVEREALRALRAVGLFKQVNK